MTVALSVIASNLITSYRRTHYRVGTDCNSISLHINQYSESLAKLLTASKQSCAAIVSAYNPYSQLASNEENLAVHEQLRNLLQHRAYPIIESLNIDPIDQWLPEKSFFVPGLVLNTSRSIGQRFNQNAIVWIDNEAIPRLILLR
ncbi:DUF3293 domain-containing protein [Nitrosomonas ureae]|uniref:DUF3293 domain-containing protein n=1 Tax=Nitrosomonas ureae TaxID=44577 RepID=A0A1H9CK34_9PROT|nr:DUF3293 domain-containing protein [Nitrosomonas ureae]SEQ01580.1 Protein of unknown function [Nitrosomonas ureae]